VSSPVSPVQEQRRGKAAQRAATQKAAAERAVRQRRNRAIGGAVGGVLAVILVISFAVWSARSDDPTAAKAPATAQTGPNAQDPNAQDPNAQDPAAQDPNAQNPNAGQPAAPPKLPEGADPALGTKPQVGAGTGDLTKLTVTPLIEGKGAETKAGQQLTVNYVGVTYRDGKEFDSSWKTGEPFDFAVGQGSVIKGWDQGLVGVKVGSRVQLDIPSDLAYGDNATGGAPAGPLRFVVDILAAQ
jgi:peptidylprolyl isomerase